MKRPDSNLGSFPFESHVIFYVATDFGITVARVLHERQDAGRHVGVRVAEQ